MDEIVIGLFAVAGGICRYLVGLALPFDNFPLGTFLINLAGSFLLAFITNFFAQRESFPQRLTLGMGTGFVGAFTTFSSFTLEILRLFLAQHYLRAAVYAFGSLICGVILAALGIYVSNLLVKKEEKQP